MSEVALVKRTGPSIARGSSRQDWGTPPEFLEAVKRRFGSIDFDLAASSHNTVVPAGEYGEPGFWGEDEDALAQDWGSLSSVVRVAFCNPPFGNIRPWAAKCESVRDLPRWTLLLVPASMGSGWWRDHVLNKCQADGIPRMTFVGAEQPYPKDLALLCYGYSVAGTGFWDWRNA